MNADQDGISFPVPTFGPGREAAASGEHSATAAGIPAAGTFWHDPLFVPGSGGLSPTPEDGPSEGGGLPSACRSGQIRPVTVAYVENGEASPQNNAESLARQCLTDACERVGSKLDTVNFGKLDFGETTVLDRFYNAGEFPIQTTTCILEGSKSAIISPQL